MKAATKAAIQKSAKMRNKADKEQKNYKNKTEIGKDYKSKNVKTKGRTFQTLVNGKANFRERK